MRSNTVDREKIKCIYQTWFADTLELPPDDPQLLYLRWALPVDPAASILDAGCGDGRYSTFLATLGYKNLHAVDILDERRLPGINYLLASIDQLPYADSSFDFVFSNSVVFYVDPPRRALAEFFRVLKSGGTLMFTAHTKWSIFTLERVIKRDILRSPRMSHLVGVKFYSASAYENMLKELGFAIKLRDGWRVSYMAVPAYRKISAGFRKYLKISLPNPTTRIANNRLLGALKSEIAYHSVFVAVKTRLLHLKN